ncbi:hypothetical protein EJB05_57379, partial [Eragrostis curvula]
MSSNEMNDVARCLQSPDVPEPDAPIHVPDAKALLAMEMLGAGQHQAPPALGFLEQMVGFDHSPMAAPAAGSVVWWCGRSDDEEFIASNPVYRSQLRVLRESRKFALAGAAHLGGIPFKYSKAPHHTSSTR